MIAEQKANSKEKAWQSVGAVLVVVVVVVVLVVVVVGPQGQLWAF